MVTLRACRVMNNSSMNDFKKVGSLYVLQKELNVHLLISVDRILHDFDMKFKSGYACDGLSVPKIFRWFLPSWDKKNGLYNLAGVVHDGLYGNKGFCVFSREECDDIFRGILRESGISRFKAGCTDKSVEWFADKHFGDDDLKVAHLVEFEV